ncbi:G patch domain and ankyrin repeat-containing protein 1 homolog isoform X1 [Amblyomma americanum]
MAFLRRVTFVRGVEQEQQAIEAHNFRSAQAAELLSGECAKRFYEDVVSQPSTSSADTHRPVTSPGVGSECSNNGRRPSPTRARAVKVSEYFTAAQRNDLSELKRCLLAGVDVDATDVFGWTALMCASCDGAERSVRYLLNKGANKHLKNTQGRTAVELAARQGHVNVVELLCKPEKLDRAEKASDVSKTSREAPGSDSEEFCSVCGRPFSSAEMKAHETSIVHQFNLRLGRSPSSTHYEIPENNAGFQMLLGMGWNRDRGFGPREQGRKFPVKTVLKRDRSGLGVEPSAPRVTHFGPHDRAAIENLRRKGSREDAERSLKRKRKDEEAKFRRMKEMEIEFRRSFH